MNFTYLVVEGPHDAELLGKILRLSDFKQVTLAEEVNTHWKPLIP